MAQDGTRGKDVISCRDRLAREFGSQEHENRVTRVPKVVRATNMNNYAQKTKEVLAGDAACGEGCPQMSPNVAVPKRSFWAGTWHPR